jgi:hypothetical protein
MYKNGITFRVVAVLLLLGVAFTMINIVDAATKQQEDSSMHMKNLALLKQTISLAQSGKTINSENFGIGTKANDIVKKWGKPDYPDSTYELYYQTHSTSFFIKSGKVSSLTSFDKRYFDVTYKEVIQAYGKPVKQTFGDDGVYVQYKVGNRVLEVVLFYDNAGKNADTIHYVHVK